MSKLHKKTKIADAVEKAYVIHPGVKETATDRQSEIIDAVNEHGSMRAAARMLGINYTGVHQAVRLATTKAAYKGFAPDNGLTRRAAPGFRIKGSTDLFDPRTGEHKLQWLRQTVDDEQTEGMLREFALSLVDVKSLAPLTPAPKAANDDLLCVYPMGDPHFGMYAWWQDAGENFDLSIAETVTKLAVDNLVSRAPTATTAILLNLGDMIHADNQLNRTKSGHALDVDGRWKKVLHVGLMTMVHCVQRLLQKHQSVIWRINPGNHDDLSSFAISVALSAWFRDEPRVAIDLSPSPFWYYQFGANLLGSTHGDTVKGTNLVGLMAADQAKAWGDTIHRHWIVGHIHHQDIKEYTGGVVEYVRTLAARDAWHNGQGYRAGRDMQCIVYDKDDGITERIRCDAKSMKLLKAA